MLLNDSFHQPTNAISRVELMETDDSGNQQLLKAKGLADEVLGGEQMVLKVQQHGFSSHAPKGSEGIVVNMGGNRDQHMMLGLEDPKTRFKDLKAGGSVQYDNGGQFAKMEDGKYVIEVGNFTIKASSLTITAPVTINGDLTVQGNISNSGDVTSSGVHAAAGHV